MRKDKISKKIPEFHSSRENRTSINTTNNPREFRGDYLQGSMDSLQTFKNNVDIYFFGILELPYSPPVQQS